MARTAPVPNIPAIPGMNPGVFIMGGGGNGGGSGGKGGGKDGKGGAGNGNNGGDSASESGRGAGACGQGSGGGCPNPAHGSGGQTTAGDPVDVATGRVSTVPALDLVLPGPMRLVIARQYSSKAIERDVGLGFGWTHSLAWEIEERRRDLVLWRGDGTREQILRPEPGQLARLSPARSIAREEGFYVLRDETGWNRYFRQVSPGNRYVLFRIQNRWDHRIELEYDQQGRLSTITDSAFRVVRVSRDMKGRIGAFEVRNGPPGAEYVRFYSYRYDDAGDLVEVKDAEGNVTRYRYGEHLLTHVEYADGLTVQHRYDRQGRCIETWASYPEGKDPSLAEGVPEVLADGRTPAKGVLHCVLDYYDDYTEVADSRQLRRYSLNEHKKVDKGCWGSSVWTQTYDENGNLTSSSDPVNATWRWIRDEWGRVICAQDPMGNLTDLGYDDAGNLAVIRDALGASTHYEHDSRGALTRVWDDLGEVVAYRYDGVGNVVEAVMPNGGVTRMAYDGHCNRIEIVEPNGGVRRIRYDYLGRVLAHVDPAGGETRYSYYPTGRLAAVTHPNGAVEAFEYDPVGRVRRIRDANDRVFELRWGGYDVIHEVVRPNGRSVRLRYDREGDLLSVTNEAGEVHRYERNGAGFIIAEHTFDGRSYSYRYDAAGRVTQMKSASLGTWSYEYDACGRLIRRENPDGSVDEFERDPLGRTITARNGDVECQLTYDARGAVTSETVLAGGETTRVDYRNDPLGRPAEVRSSLGFHEWVERDLMGSPTRIRFADGREIRLQYDLCNREVVRELPDGGAIHSFRDAIGLLAQRCVTTPGAATRAGEPAWVGPRPQTTVWQKSFSYSPGGELLAEHDPRVGTTRYEHDPLGQLIAVIPPGVQKLMYGYDETGNRFASGGEQYAAGGKMLQHGSVAYAHDAEGALVERRDASSAAPPWRYHWSDGGLLQRVDKPDGTTLSFVYDAFARRVLKKIATPGGGTYVHRYVWSGDVLLHEVRRHVPRAGDPVVEVRTYCHGPRDPVPMAQRTDRIVGEQRVEGAWEFLVTDANDAPDAIVSGQGKVLVEIEMDAWGKVGDTSRAATSFRFPGQYEDEETGLFYNRYRYYDPELGRYISPDPIRLQGSLHAYTYAGNRPDSAIDPDGLQTIVTITRRDGSTVERSQGQEQPYHVAVDRALSPCTAHTAGAPRLQPETDTSAERGGRRPSACAEPAALSAHFRDWEDRNCPPRGSRAPIHPDTEEGRRSLSDALGEIREENGIAARDQNGREMAPCANCSQTIPNLWRLTGPNATPPPNVIAPGYTPQSIAAMERGNAPGAPQRFTPPQRTEPSYEQRLREHNQRHRDDRVVHTWDARRGWTSRRP
ncbi:RHS repeat-associated core domain-containing protein [Sorangium sp. So ce513]|uniref:RHS repeat-associated core domain-containing protein n=1 Tax=Sorangium sp. So ce513 TaxID=3133315 RepID=UPI003F631BF7